MSLTPNASQIESWDGGTGEHWVAEAERYDRMTGAFGEHRTGDVEALSLIHI